MVCVGGFKVVGVSTSHAPNAAATQKQQIAR
jgi:hypothetical protein